MSTGPCGSESVFLAISLASGQDTAAVRAMIIALT